MRKLLPFLLCAMLPFSAPAAAQQASALEARIRRLTSTPVLRHATVGVDVYDLTTHQTLVAMNPEKLFTAGSTTKVVTEGAALALLGGDYRFHTRVYSTGKITPDGTLHGDLVLVASGDPNLSGRVEQNDVLDFTDFDHSYAGRLPGESVIGDPMHVFKELAIDVLRLGVWRIRGRVLVDASLFPSNHVEPGTHTTVSPIVLNDNVIDVKVWPGPKAGDPVMIESDPALPYLRVIGHVRTGPRNSDPTLHFASDVAHEDGTHTVVLVGSVPAGGERAQAAYKVPDPVLYATMAFRAALRWAHIDLQDDAADTAAVASAVPQAEPQEKTVLAEHVSPPFREEVRLTLKVSQNLHAATTPYLLGAILAHHSTDAFQQGLALERKFLMQAGLDPESVSQLDGEGGMGSAFSPDFMVRYLAYMNRQPYGRTFFNALPVLGRDGTLSEMLTNSPAAGHVHAKTGSYVVSNALDDGVIVLGKGLVGYVDARNGHRLAFAAYANFVPLHDMNDVAELAEMLCRLAEAIYLDAPPASASSPRPPAR